ncbi:NAD(P)H-binding protein [Streptomyces graminofaciens]|nr:NAD(P)H-binding protein [Streptomyces graminofaciens]
MRRTPEPAGSPASAGFSGVRRGAQEAPHDAAKAGRRLPAESELVVADVTQPETLVKAVDGVDAIVLTLGSDGGAHSSPENVDYAGVRNILAALNGQTPRIALMTAIGVTARGSAYNHLLDWKRTVRALCASRHLHAARPR